MINHDLLEELKCCVKNIDKVFPRKEKTQYNHKQQTVIISSNDWNFLFELFTRQNIDLPNDFSVGLQWKWPERTIMLCRYNWDHGEHRNKLENKIINWYHIHQYNRSYKEAWLWDDSYAEETKIYNTFLQALLEVFRNYNIVNYSEFFKELPVTWSLFDIS